MKVISTLCTLCLLFSLSLFTAQSFADDSPLAGSQSSLNINTATAQQISGALKGIGMKKAEAIVEYRENYGEFAHVDELIAVKGIGKGTLEKNQHLIRLE